MSSSKKQNTYSILVVDDSHDIALIMKLKLEDAGYPTLMTNSPSDVYAFIAEYEFKLALIDINMPGINGLELLDFMHKEVPYTPVIMVTAHGSEEIAVDAMKRGAADYLSKPFEAEELLIRVEGAILNASKLPVTINMGEIIEDVLKNIELKEELDGVAIIAGPITKSIEFDEDAYQAGVSILGYFSTVVKQKYPNTKVKVKIEQEGNTVRLIVETPEGGRELIEKTLEDYGLVVVGEMQPAELLPDKLHEMQLRHKLDLAVMEVSYTKELLAFSQESHKNEIAHISEEVNHLKEQIRAAFRREDHAREVLLRIIDNRAIHGEVKDAILKLSDLIEQKIQEDDKEVVLELISIIKSKNGPAYEDIKAYLISSLGGASGNLLSSWLPMFLTTLVK